MNADDIALVQDRDAAASCSRELAMTIDTAPVHWASTQSQTTLLQGADALQLYLVAIDRNLEAIDEQLALLRGAIVERKRLQHEFNSSVRLRR